MRKGMSDSDGKFVGYEYSSEIIELNLENKGVYNMPEIIGGEWLSKWDKE
jgi:hypothetical protein